MLKVLPSRTLEEGQLVEIYFNLHKKCYSIRDCKTGLVVAHADEVVLRDVTFHVSQAGRERVLREKRKNVHATIRGSFVLRGSLPEDTGLNNFYYNPYEVSQSVDNATHEPLYSASYARCSDKSLCYTL